MAEILMTAGDDFEHPMHLQKDKVPLEIDPSSTVEAALVDEFDVVLISATNVSEATAGSDWKLGQVIVKFTSAQTTIAGAPRIVKVEIQITTAAGKKTTHYSDFFELAFGAIA